MSRAGQDYYLHADHQGSIVRVTDSAGAVVNSYAYDAYGRRLAATEGVELPYGYTGREFDAESGLMYYRARMYDPATGRFLQTDPLGFAAGDLNLYRYAFNDPVNRRDPDGQIGQRIIGCAISGLAAASGQLAGSLITEAALNELAERNLAPAQSCGRNEEILNEVAVGFAVGCIAGFISPPATTIQIVAPAAGGFALGVYNSAVARGLI